MQPSLPSKAPGFGLEPLDLSRIAQDLQLRKVQVESVVHLLDEGNTIPFITRYRKEVTGGLDEEILRIIQGRVQAQRQLNDRRQTILKSIEAQGKLTDDLRQALHTAESPKRLEDLYLPYKPKKRSLATTARERGLEPFAQAIWNADPAVANLAEVLPTLINPEKEVNTPEDVLLGAQHILAEHIAETAEVRASMRNFLWDVARICTTKSEKLSENQGREYKSYFNFNEGIKHIPPHRILAINRGEKEHALTTRLEFDPGIAMRVALDVLPIQNHPHATFLEAVVQDSLTRLLLPSLEREIRRELTNVAEDHAVRVFARNLRSLLLAPPLQGKQVLAIDPGFRTGCKLAALDASGNLLGDAVIFPHPPQNKRPAAQQKLEELVRRYQIQVIAIGNGTACRETEELVSDLIADLEKRRQSPGDAAPVVVDTPAPLAVTTQPVVEAPSGMVSTQYPEVTTPPPTVEIPSDLVSPDLSGPATPPPVEVPSDAVSMESSAMTSPSLTETPPTVPEAAPPAPPAEPLPEAPADLAYVIVNESGASVYSASPIGREEFPNFDATTRGTISIGRRLQDPLSELVKIDPQSVGVGLYQHDVGARQLKESLESVIESCVNQVGVDLNTASVPLLRHVSGLNQLVARDLVEYRKQHGPFKNREQLREVPNIGPTRWVQAAGFLKIVGGEDPLDTTWIHPESYPLARQVLADLGANPEALLDREKTEELRSKLAQISPEEVAQRLQAGIPTVKDILQALARPGRDPREDVPPPIFKKGILRLEDLHAGMELKGTVLNVVDFGAFVDIGIKDTGLVHISQMANRFIKSPHEVVSVGDVVTVWVMGVDSKEHKVSLSMMAPGTTRRGPERGSPPPRQERRDRHERPQEQQGGPERREQGDRPPPRGRRPGGPPPRRGGPPQRREGGPPPQEGAAAQGTGQTHTDRRGPRGRQAAPPPQQQPRRPARPTPKPKLSQAQLKGAADLRSFGELAAFLEAKKVDDTPPAPPPEPAPAPVEETPTTTGEGS